MANILKVTYFKGVLVLSLLLTFSCNKENTVSTSRDLHYYVTSTTAVSDAIKIYQSTASLSDLSAYLQTNYGVENFEEVYNKVVPYIHAHQGIPNLQNQKGETSDSTLASLSTMFLRAGIPLNSKSYTYVKEIEDVFLDSASMDASLVIPKLQAIKSEIENDETIEASEKNSIVSISDMLIQNYEAFVQISSNIADSNIANAGGRINCWVCKAWRVVRSVVVTVVAVAIVVVATVYSLGIATPTVGLIAGAVIGAAWSGYSAAHDKCYYAVNCGSDDSDAAGSQKCSTGECIQD